MKYTLVHNDGVETIVAYIDGNLYTANDSHPNWVTLKAKCEDGTVTVNDFDAVAGITEFMELVDGFAIDNGVLTLNGEAMNGTLANKVVYEYRAGKTSHALTNFVNELSKNPSRNSRDQLFKWLDRSGFELDDEGWIVGYKAVNERDGKFYSITAGEAYVNGVQETGYIPQEVGDVVTMNRSDVTDNPGIGCSHGLHVGTFEYARSFGGHYSPVLKVLVSPADVVSVPDDANSEKMRVCKYEVHSVYEHVAQADVIWPNSSFIDRIEWSGGPRQGSNSLGNLEVDMKFGGTYTYSNVPYYEFVNIKHYNDVGDSVGSYYTKNIKGRYTAA